MTLQPRCFCHLQFCTTLGIYVLGKGSHEDHTTHLNFSNGFIYFFNFKEYNRMAKNNEKDFLEKVELYLCQKLG